MISNHQIEDFRSDLRKFERAIDRINRSHCRSEINVAQCHTIMDIGQVEFLSLNNLAERMNLDKSTVSRQVEKLVHQGDVLREPSAEDRRKVNISLTPKGVEFYRTVNRSLNDEIHKVFADIPKEELVVFRKVFKQLSKTL